MKRALIALLLLGPAARASVVVTYWTPRNVFMAADSRAAMPDGSRREARFRTFQWPVDETPGGIRLFACQHKTRDTVWIPELQRHANTARSIARVLIVSPEPKKASRATGAP